MITTFIEIKRKLSEGSMTIDYICKISITKNTVSERGRPFI